MASATKKPNTTTISDKASPSTELIDKHKRKILKYYGGMHRMMISFGMKDDPEWAERTLNLFAVEEAEKETKEGVSQDDTSVSKNTPSAECIDKHKRKILKAYGGMYHFMMSMGLKMWDEDDYEEGEHILTCFAEDEAEKEEAEGPNCDGSK